MANIQVSSFSNGTNSYSMTYNPVFFDAAGGLPLTEVKILHGASVWQKRAWDSRLRILEWRKNKVDGTPFSAQMTKMRTWKGKVMYFNFQSIVGFVNNWPASNTWKKCRIIDVIEEYQPGGTLKYETVRVLIQPEL